MIDIPYKPHKREATVRAYYDEIFKKWDVYIVGVQYVHRPTIEIAPIKTDSLVGVVPIIVDEEIATSEKFEKPEKEKFIVEFQNLPVSIKRGKSLDITWTESKEEKSRNLLLYLDGIKVKTLKNDLKTNQYQWTIPDKQSIGKGYQLALTFGESKEVYFGEDFKIKRKVPLGVKIIVPAAIIGTIPLWCCKGNGKELPEPPTIQ